MYGLMLVTHHFNPALLRDPKATLARAKAFESLLAAARNPRPLTDERRS